MRIRQTARSRTELRRRDQADTAGGQARPAPLAPARGRFANAAVGRRIPTARAAHGDRVLPASVRVACRGRDGRHEPVALAWHTRRRRADSRPGARRAGVRRRPLSRRARPYRSSDANAGETCRIRKVRRVACRRRAGSHAARRASASTCYDERNHRDRVLLGLDVDGRREQEIAAKIRRVAHS